MLKAILLLGAIVSEVFGSTMLKKSDGFKKVLPTMGFVVGYLGAFVGLSLSLANMTLGVVYAIWSGLGTALTVLVGIYLFKEKANKNIFIGVFLILIGVVLLNLEKVH